MAEYPHHVIAGGLYGAIHVNTFLSADHTAQLYFNLKVAAASDPEWAKLFIAGVVGDTMMTLADDDPWRRAHCDHGWPLLDVETFGSLADHSDLIRTNDLRHEKPYEILAISEPLSLPAARLLSAAAGGRTELWNRIEKDDLTPGQLVAFGTEAMRVALYRRSRVLRIAPDPWAESICMRWACWAGNIRRGTAVVKVEALADAEIQQHKITDGQYLAAAERIDDDATFWRIVERLM